jgi:hypothetical protein
LNRLQPTRAEAPQFEQRGCLHANMDLYKWAYKLSPLVPSELVADCFALARDIRTLDMRASPYDLTDLGHPPVRIETPEGRAEYVAAQRGFAERAAPLRARLIAECDRFSRPAVCPAGAGRPADRTTGRPDRRISHPSRHRCARTTTTAWRRAVATLGGWICGRHNSCGNRSRAG